MTVINDDLPAELAWLELLPDDFELPAGYVDAHLSRLDSLRRHAEVSELIASHEQRLRDLIAGGIGPLEYASSTLVAELAGLRDYAGQMPPTPPAVSGDEAVAVALSTRIPNLGPGVPPLACLDLIHHLEAHARDGLAAVPMTNDTDLEALDFFERASTAAADLEASAATFRAPLNGSPIGARVQAWAQLMPQAQRHAAGMRKLRAIIAEADRLRVEAGLAHRCPRWGGAGCAGDPSRRRCGGRSRRPHTAGYLTARCTPRPGRPLSLPEW